MQKKSCLICKTIALLVIIGALNWGAIGILNVNVVTQLIGNFPTAERVLYILIGVAGVLKLISCFKCCPCTTKSSTPTG